MARMLNILRHIVQAVSQAADFNQALNQIARNVCHELQTDVCGIFIADHEQNCYVLMAQVGWGAQDLIGRVGLNFGEGVVGLVGEREEPINLENIHAHPAYIAHPLIDEQNFHGFVGVPILHQRLLLGVLVVERCEIGAFLDEEEALLVTLSAQLAGEIATAEAKGHLAAAHKKRKNQEAFLKGLSSIPGLALGRGLVVYPIADLDAVPERETREIEVEIALFETALAATRRDMLALQQRAQSVFSTAEQTLFDAYLQVLDSRSLIEEIIREIKTGQWACGALKRVIKRHIFQLESLDDSYIRERAADLRDLGQSILAHLQQTENHQATRFPKATILVGYELSVSQLMEVPEGQLLGIVTATGSSNSHVAILARALGLPAIMGIPGLILDSLDGRELLLDGYSGYLYVSPSKTIKEEFRTLIDQEREMNAALSELHDLPAETLDAQRICLTVNTGLAADIGMSLSVGAEGVGLYRTEMPFMLHERFPSEEEQRVIYRQLLQAFAPHPVVMRTLDIGGDKQLPYFDMQETNPFLGWRGIRVTLDHPEIFLQQVRAMLQASHGLDNLKIMLPMISTLSEVDAARQLIRQAHQELQDEGLEVTMPPLGLMVEVPVVVHQAYEFAKSVDFLSVGSNDLIQYMLAVDRNNLRVANLYDGLHPGILRALHKVVEGAHKAHRPVSICGEMACDPLAVPVLLGMGFDSLSMSARNIPRVKWIIRNIHFSNLKQLLKEVLKMDEAREVRNHLEATLDEWGLGSLLRAGR